MGTLVQAGWEIWLGLWWISGIIIFLFVVFLVIRVMPGINDSKKQRRKLKKRYRNHKIDKQEYQRLTKQITEKEKLYQN